MVDQQNNNKKVFDIEENRLMAALSYVGVLVFIPLISKKEDEFVRFHARQGLVLLAGIVLAVTATAWSAVTGNVLFSVLMILNLIGLVQALLGRRWKIPVIGDLAQRFRV